VSAGPEALRVWIVADRGDASVVALGDALGDDFEVTVLAAQEVVQRLVREAGGELIGSLRDLLRGIRDGESEAEPEHKHLPDVVVVTAADTFGAGNAFTRLTGDDVLRIGLVADYALGTAWLDAPLHAWVVPVESFVPPLVDAGVDESRIEVAGPPVPEDYGASSDGASLREEWGLGPEPVVFVHCDRGVWDLDRLAFQFSLLESDVQPIFYAGADPAVADKLRRAAAKHGVEADLLGAVPSLRDFHAVADLVVAPVEDPRIVYVLAMDRPLLLVGEAEVRTQVEFLTALGAARHVPDVLRLGTELDLLAAGDTLGRLRQASATVGKPDGTAKVAEAIARLIVAREDILAAGREAPETRRGPFERIGAPRAKVRVPGAPAQRSASASSEAQAKDELANLIMMEREAEQKATESARAVEQWRQRLELATEWNETELAKEAEVQLERATAAEDAGREELERTRLQKEKLKESVRRGRGDAPAPPTAAPSEKFEDMEVERDLAALRKRLRDELD
jgi:hypothetical protein